MSRKYKFYYPEGLYFVSFAIINWVDVFVRILYVDIIVNSLKLYKEKGMRIYSWCVNRSIDVIDQKLDYIHNNPVEAGFVREVDFWQYSSAIYYSGASG